MCSIRRLDKDCLLREMYAVCGTNMPLFFELNALRDRWRSGGRRRAIRHDGAIAEGGDGRLGMMARSRKGGDGNRHDGAIAEGGDGNRHDGAIAEGGDGNRQATAAYFGTYISSLLSSD